MELIELVLDNFKKFRDGRFDFCPSLNLIWGPNESGKSTIHEAICYAIFGRERNKPVGNWDGGPCSVALTYRSNGKLFRIERSLSDGASRLGVVREDNLTDVVSRKDDIDRTLAEHMGITSRVVFNNTVSVRQMDVSQPNASDMAAVGSEIQRVLTGTAHTSAMEALKRLEAGRGEVKGRARPSNPREYDDVVIRLNKLAEELADARASREQIRNLEAEFADLEVTNEADSKRFQALEALLQRHDRWSELKQKEAKVDRLHASVFSSLKKLKDTLADLKFAQKELEGYADLVDKDEEIAEHLAKIDSRRVELDTRLAQLQPPERQSCPTRGKPTSALLIAGTFLLSAAGVIGAFLIDVRSLVLLAPAAVLAFVYASRRAANLETVSRHVTDLVTLARNELKQLDVEEKSILNYIKCQDTGKAWTKIKTYRNQVAAAHELEVTLNALLNGRKLQDWEAEEADLDRELTRIRRELEEEFPAYSPTTEEAESWRSEYAALRRSTPSSQARLHVLLGSLEAEKRNTRDLAALQGEIEYLHRRKNELEFLCRAYDEAISALTSVTQTVSEEYLPAVSECASDCMRQVTSSRYTSVSIRPDWKVSLDCRDKSAVEPPMLSIGTLDQLYIALRIACGRMLSTGRKLPLILDDPFASFDRDRLDNALDFLAELAGENQILLLTHDPHVLDWARVLSAGSVPCHIHELAGPGSQ